VTLLTLVRHGTTEWIEQGRLHGVSDSPLSARGVRESQLVAQALAGQHFDAFYTSPLGRARQTADIIAASIELEPVPLEDLREMNFGWLEGGHGFNFAKDPPVWREVRAAWIALAVQASGEPRRKFADRVAHAAREIAARHPGQRVLAVIHMAVRGNMLACLVDGDRRAYVRYDGWPACAFTELELTPEGRARIIRLSVSDHLEGKP
jgi:probable phosphoglycerate mutase